MRIAFRADASRVIGSGHVARCRALAAKLRRRAGEVVFVSREDPDRTVSRLLGDDVPLNLLPHIDRAGHDWNEERDAADTIDVLANQKVDWLVMDHYGLSAAWEEKLQPHAARILAIDDFANRKHACDILVDQNFTLAGNDRYAPLIPQECTQLLGPHYALLADAYAAAAQLRQTHAETVQRAVVSFGGSDATELAALALQAFMHPSLAHIDVDVVTASHAARKTLEDLAHRRPRTCVHGPQPNLVNLFTAADIAVGAGGTTTWERCCLGLPTIVVVLAENQARGVRDLAAASIVESAGRRDNVDVELLRRTIMNLSADTARRQTMSVQGSLLVDGHGAARVAETMIPTASENLTLRPADERDCPFFFRLANDSDVRRESFHSDAIPWETHQSWFADKLNDPSTQLLVFEADGLPVGQIRFDRREDAIVLNYALERFVRGRGWGTKLVAMSVSMVTDSANAPIRAEVKAANVASRRVFERLGFRKTPETNGGRINYVLSRI